MFPNNNYAAVGMNKKKMIQYHSQNKRIKSAYESGRTAASIYGRSG